MGIDLKACSERVSQDGNLLERLLEMRGGCTCLAGYHGECEAHASPLTEKEAIALFASCDAELITIADLYGENSTTGRLNRALDSMKRDIEKARSIENEITSTALVFASYECRKIRDRLSESSFTTKAEYVAARNAAEACADSILSMVKKDAD